MHNKADSTTHRLAPVDRLPPQNIEAEQSVIGAVLLENEAFKEIKDFLLPEDFYKESHKKIYTAMLEMYAENMVIDLVTLTAVLSKKDQLEAVGGASYLSHIASLVPTAANIRHHAKIVKEKATCRRTVIAGIEIVAMGYDDDEDASTVIAKAQILIGDVAVKSGGGDEAGHAGGSLEETLSCLNILETPLQILNEAVGGISKTRLTLVGGLRGMGKTSFNLDLIRHTFFEEDLPVAYFGARSPKRDHIRGMLLSAMCEIDFKDMSRGKLNRKQLEKLTEANKKLDDTRFVLDVTAEKMNVAAISSKLRGKVKEVGEFGLIVIENIQDLIWWPEGTRNDIDQMNQVTDVLISLQDEMNAPLILSSQINKDVLEREDQRPRIGDNRLCLKLEDAAGLILLLHRPDYHVHKKKGDKSQKEFEEAELIIAKGGPTSILPLTFWGKHFTWKDE